jgi:hypothetical protein
MKKSAALKMMGGGEMFLFGTVCPLRQKYHKAGCKVCERGGHGPYWYLTWKEGGKPRALYIRPGYAGKARAAVRNMRRLRKYMLEMGLDNIKKFKKQMEARKR